MALEDIEKLKEKVARDPNSKLFVPLADEYRKMGMVDEAITVLVQGLETQPNYMSARVALGKTYLEKNMLHEAKDEFDKVVTAIPDNLFAHKKLAEIYKELGKYKKSVEQYNEVIKLNPKDEDSILNIEALINKEDVEDAVSNEEEPIPNVVSGAVPPPPLPPLFSSPDDEDETAHAEEGTATTHYGDDFEEFRKTISEHKVDKDESGDESADSEKPLKEPKPIPVKKSPPPSQPYAAAEKPAQVKESAVPDEKINKPNAEVKTKPVEPEEFVLMTEDIKAESAAIIEETVVVEEPAQPQIDMNSEKKYDRLLEDADANISNGNLQKAMEIYGSLLAENPKDKRVLQKAEEVKMLLKMLDNNKNSGKDLTVAKLEALKNGLQRKRNEFFSNT